MKSKGADQRSVADNLSSRLESYLGHGNQENSEVARLMALPLEKLARKC
jgi:hypothetical protein